jgi:ATP-dependent DNA helicase RecG
VLKAQKYTHITDPTAHDARALLAADPALEGPRGQAVRVLLWLMEQDRAIRLIGVG